MSDEQKLPVFPAWLRVVDLRRPILVAGDSIPGGQATPRWMEAFIHDASHTWPHPDEVRAIYPACKFIRTVPFG